MENSCTSSLEHSNTNQNNYKVGLLFFIFIFIFLSFCCYTFSPSSKYCPFTATKVLVHFCTTYSHFISTRAKCGVIYSNSERNSVPAKSKQRLNLKKKKSNIYPKYIQYIQKSLTIAFAGGAPSHGAMNKLVDRIQQSWNHSGRKWASTNFCYNVGVLTYINKGLGKKNTLGALQERHTHRYCHL